MLFVHHFVFSSKSSAQTPPSLRGLYNLKIVSLILGWPQSIEIDLR